MKNNILQRELNNDYDIFLIGKWRSADAQVE